MSTSDTPRTDAAVEHPHDMTLENDLKEYRGEPIISECAPADFARQLERELSAAQARVAELERDKARLDWLENDGKYSEFEWGDDLRAAIDAAMKEGTP